jgi:Cu(I)/Ag(I) efflux system membrane protein CusA/SilA
MDLNRLAAAGINLMDVFNAVRNSNIDVGAKVVERGGMEFIIRGVGFLKSVDDINHISIMANDGTPVFLKDIATIQVGPEFRRGALDKDGKEAVGGVLIVRYRENPLEVIKRVKTRIRELSPGLPDGVKIVPFYDRTELIGQTTNTLRETLFEEIVICILIVFLFIGHLRSAFVISLSLPIAIGISFIIMYYLGIDANIMSLGGIAIAIGTLVDAGIIMVENIHRHLVLDQNRRPSAEVVLKAAKEVGSAIVTGIMSTIISFIPVFALEAQEGKLFKPLAFTKTFALAGSIVIALTLTVVLCFYLLKGRLRPIETNPLNRRLLKIYERILRWVLKHRLLFISIPAGIILVAAILFTRIGSEFMPQFDEGTVLFMPVVSPSVSLTEALKIIRVQDSIIKAFPEVEDVVGKLGRAETPTDPAPIEMFETIINLKNKKHWRKGVTKDSLIREMDAALKLPGVSNIWTQPIVNRIDMLSTGIRTPVGVKIFGTDLDTLQVLAQEIKNIIQKVKGAEDLYAEKITGKPYIEIIPRRTEIARFDISIRDIMDIVEMAVGGENLTTIYHGRERYPVRVRIARELRDSPEKLRNILIPTNAGHVPLGQIADVKVTEGPAMINSENGMLRAYVLANVRDRDLAGFVREASTAVAREMAGKLPPGYSIQWSGQYENQVRAQGKLFVLIPLSLLIIYLINFMNFRSHRKSLTIFLAVPVTMAGGVILLSIYGLNFSVAVWVGFIAVFGIADDDAILITTYLDQVFKRRQPKTKAEVTEATVEAGKTRFRPAFMTTATAFLALLPIFIFGGTGKEIMLPMAIPSFGGMIVHMVTWFVVPTIYSWFEERKTQRADTT